MASSEDACMPIAVIGMGCRFPGEATSPENLWDMLANGKNAWSEFPKDRINIDGFYHPSTERQGSICFRGGHFLKEDVAAWDAPFFSITAHEAAAMDPQQRILLEVSYEAFENAGIPIENLPGTSTAVYCGSFVKDYEQICLRDPDNSPQYAATGNGIAIMSNRISWFYDLRGPSMTLDTGCSASLVGVHLACQSLRTGESTLAIAMGAGLVLTPATMLPMTALNFLSPDGKCFAFDERANGYGRGEGIGAVVLKPLHAALRDNDTIRAVIRGSGVNQDGKTPGITMPSKEAQALNIRTVYSTAGLDYDSTAYFEAHGTGTQAGDPTELGAISETFTGTRDPVDPLYVGSVKTNIGHLEGCAGIAGLIKSVLMLEKGLVPANLYFENVNPRIDLDAWRIKIPKELTPWPREGLRRISLNCFGFGGTNAHIILDDSLHYLSSRGIEGSHCSIDWSSRPSTSNSDSGVGLITPPLESTVKDFLHPNKIPRLYVFSAHEESGIVRLSEVYSEYIKRKNQGQVGLEVDLVLGADLAHTLSNRRTQFSWKAFVVSSSPDELDTEFLTMLSKPHCSTRKSSIAFVFSGQGAQWFAMGRELLQYQKFYATLHEADQFLRSIGSEWSLMDELLKDEESSLINLPSISQPLCTTLQIALLNLLRDWDVVPQAVVGHSSGEIAALYTIGAVSQEDALKLAFHRGKLTSALKTLAPTLRGRMMAVALSENAARLFVSRLRKGTAIIACINSPENVTVSGDEDALLELEELLHREGIFTRMLKVENAYHSHHMKHIESQYLEAIEDIKILGRNSETQMFSSVTGKLIRHDELGPAYWARNLVSPVQFTKAINAMLRMKPTRPNVLLEIGPHSVLQAPLKQILDARDKTKARPNYFSMLIRGKNATRTALEAAGHLWSLGTMINFEKVHNSSQSSKPRSLGDLPSYPWNHSKTYWHESHLGTAHRFRKFGRQDLIGAPTADSVSHESRWRGFLRVSENRWIQDHQVQNTIIYPAAGMLSMVLEAARQIKHEDFTVHDYELANVHIEKAMIVPDSAHGLETALNVKKLEDITLANDLLTSHFEFSVYSKLLNADWIKNAHGSLAIHYVSDELTDTEELNAQFKAAQHSCKEKYSPRQLYEAFEGIGLKYGPSFQNIVFVSRQDNLSCTTVRIPDTAKTMPANYEYPHLIHPATLDATFQTVFIAGSEPMIPSFLKKMTISAEFPSGAGSELKGFSEAKRFGIRDATGCITMFNSSEEKPMLIVEDLHFTALSTARDDLTPNGYIPNHYNLCSELVWSEVVGTSFIPTTEELNGQEVILILPSTPSVELLDASTKICSQISLIGMKTTTSNLLKVQEVCKEKLCIALLEVDSPLVSGWTKDDFEAFRILINEARGCLWITRGGQVECFKPLSSPINALFRTLRAEDSRKLLYTLDLDLASDTASGHTADIIKSVLQRSFGSISCSRETEYAERAGRLLVSQLVLQIELCSKIERGDAQRAPTLQPFLQQDRSLRLELGEPGHLDSFYFDDDPDATLGFDDQDIEIKVKAVGISQFDVETAMGKTSNHTIGSDVAGIVTRLGSGVSGFQPGDRVATIVQGGFKTLVRAQETSVQRIPDDITFEVAVSFLSDTVAAYHSVLTVGRLQQGESVLIHSGASGLGQLAIQISKYVEAEIYATVHSCTERETLIEVYGLRDDHIFHQASFSKELRRMSGDGVDLVLNTLGSKRNAQSWKCVSEFGRFVQLGYSQYSDAAMLNLMASHRNASYSTVDLDHIAKRNPPLLSRLLASAWKLVQANIIHSPNPLSARSLSELSGAFKEAQNQTHGKIVIKLDDKDTVPIIPREIHPLRLDPDATYILVGGLGGLGRSIAQLLREKGARNLVFISRSGATTEEQKLFLEHLKAAGVRIRVYACDICDRSQLSAIVQQCQIEMPQIKGVVQGAAVIKDAIFENMTYDDWIAATKPKINGSWNLHEMMPKDLDFFIFLSSCAGIIGARGQANYNAGNGFQDALAQHRRAEGLSGVSLDLGPILGAGMVAEDEATLEMLRTSGFINIREKDFHTIICAAMTGYTEDNNPIPAQVTLGTGTGGIIQQNQVRDPYWLREARFATLAAIDLQPESSDPKAISLKKLLSSTSSLVEASEIILEGLVILLSKSMNMLPADLDTRKPANAYGVDSLVAVGTRNWIFQETGVDVSIFEILSEVSISDMADGIAKKCRICAGVVGKRDGGDED